MPNFQSRGEMIAVVLAVLVFIQGHVSPTAQSAIGWFAVIVAMVLIVHLITGLPRQLSSRLWNPAVGRDASEPNNETAPVSIRNVVVEDGRNHAPALSWPMKISVVLHNDSAENIHVGELGWISTAKGAQLHVNPTEGIGSQYQIEGGRESKQITVAGGKTFKLWVGVKMIEAKQLGTLVLPINLGGKTRDYRFRL